MSESSIQNLRANLQAVLATQDLSQTELARRLGVHQRAISRLVGNVADLHSPTLATVAAIAKGLGVSVPELLSPNFAPTTTAREVEPRDSPTLVRQTSRLIEDFFASDSAGRKKILTVAAESADNRVAKGTRGEA